MKWSWLGVILLGIVAAVCMAGIVALMPAYLRPVKQDDAVPAEVKMVVAAEPLEAMEMVDASSVKVTTVAASEAPEKYLSSEAQVLGRVLSVGMVAGQPFTPSSFISEGGGAQLATTLPPGKRAIGIMLSEDCALLNLLYPGCIVDVLATQRGAKDTDVARILLEGIPVLAIEDHSIVSKDKPDSNSSIMDRSKKKTVVLMVDPAEARLIQANQQQSVISLVMRNPSEPVVASNVPAVEPAEEKITTPPPSPQVHEITVYRDGKPEKYKILLAKAR